MYSTKFISEPYNCDLGSSVNSRIEYSIIDKDVGLDDMLEQFQYFLLACGYPISETQDLMIVEREEENLWDTLEEDDPEDLSGVTRVEVIDAHGRSYTNNNCELVILDVQDEGRTLKVFIKEGMQS